MLTSRSQPELKSADFDPARFTEFVFNTMAQIQELFDERQEIL